MDPVVQLFVPEAEVSGDPVVTLRYWTSVTLVMASDAVPPRVTDEELVLKALAGVGVVTVTTGGVGS